MFLFRSLVLKTGTPSSFSV